MGQFFMLSCVSDAKSLYQMQVLNVIHAYRKSTYLTRCCDRIQATDDFCDRRLDDWLQTRHGLRGKCFVENPPGACVRLALVPEVA